MSNFNIEQLKKILLNPNDIKVSPKQIIIGVLSIIVIATIIAVIIPEETETTNTNTTTNNNPQFSKEEQQNANDYIITMEATGLIKEIKTVCDDGSKGCFYFLIDENLWNNYTNYDTKRMVLNASEIYASSKDPSYKFYIGRGYNSGKKLYDVWGIKQ